METIGYEWITVEARCGYIRIIVIFSLLLYVIEVSHNNKLRFKKAMPRP